MLLERIKRIEATIDGYMEDGNWIFPPVETCSHFNFIRRFDQLELVPARTVGCCLCREKNA